MTSLAMIAGMLPMAIGRGEGGAQAAPLGRAVIGGLLGATPATLVILPAVFAALQGERTRRTASLDPDDPESPQYVRGLATAPTANGEENGETGPRGATDRHVITTSNQP